MLCWHKIQSVIYLCGLYLKLRQRFYYLNQTALNTTRAPHRTSEMLVLTILISIATIIQSEKRGRENHKYRPLMYITNSTYSWYRDRVTYTSQGRRVGCISFPCNKKHAYLKLHDPCLLYNAGTLLLYETMDIESMVVWLVGWLIHGTLGYKTRMRQVHKLILKTRQNKINIIDIDNGS